MESYYLYVYDYRDMTLIHFTNAYPRRLVYFLLSSLPSSFKIFRICNLTP